MAIWTTAGAVVGAAIVLPIPGVGFSVKLIVGGRVAGALNALWKIRVLGRILGLCSSAALGVGSGYLVVT